MFKYIKKINKTKNKIKMLEINNFVEQKKSPKLFIFNFFIKITKFYS